MAKQIKTQIAELEYLRSMLVKYRVLYYQSQKTGYLSARMYRWIDTYDAYARTPAWPIYCKKNSLDPSHYVYDLFA